MANREQIEKIEVIQEEKARARRQHLKIANELSGGHPKYKTAINTMISVGALAVVFSVLRIAITIAEVVSFTTAGGEWDSQSIVFLALEFGILITTSVLGAKLYFLDATPVFMLVALIIILITNALLFSGILPLVTAALSIVGLVCWGTYRNWFNDIDTKASKEPSGEEEDGD